MLKIFSFDTRTQRRVIVEGKLIAPWDAEVKTVCEVAQTDLEGRELVIELKSLTAISQEAENLLRELKNQGVKFRCRGVFTKHVLRRTRSAIRNGE